MNHIEHSPKAPSRRDGLFAIRVSALALLALAFFAATLALSSPARAAYTAGTPLSTGTSPAFPATSVAVNQSSRDLYVATGFGSSVSFPGSLLRFDSSGNPLAFTGTPAAYPVGVAINPTNGNVYLDDRGSFVIGINPMLRTYDAAGTATGTPFTLADSQPFPQPGVDAAGDIYLPNTVTGAVQVFQPNGSADEPTHPITGLAAPNSVALDAAGDIYVAETGKAGVNEKQTVTFTGFVANDTFSLGNLPASCSSSTAGPITYATGATGKTNILNALTAACGSGNFAGTNITATSPTNTVLTFQGAFAATDEPTLSCTTNTGTGSCGSAETTAAVPPKPAQVSKFGADGTPLGVFFEGAAGSVAVDKSSGDIFVGVGRGPTFHVEKYSAGGGKLADFGAGVFVANPPSSTSIYNQLAVDDTSGTVYAADGGSSKVQVFNFAAGPSLGLTLEKTGSGQGTVISDRGEPTAIDCGPLCSEETRSFEETSYVTLTASEEIGSEFKEWEGCEEPGPLNAGTTTGLTVKQCRVKMGAAKTVKAVFALEGFTLAIDTSSGTGTGSINCKVDGGPTVDAPCATSYPEGTELELIAAEASGSTFVGFEDGAGAAAGCSTSPCSFTLTGASSVAANFAQNAPTATNDAPGTIAQTQVVLKGHVDNEGAAAGSTCRFVIALESSPGTPVAEPACSPDPVTGDTSTAVEATASGLTANTAYVYRVVATNAGGTTTGSPDQAAQTLPNAPTATNDAPGTIAQTQVVLKGHVDNEGAAAGSTCRFVIETAAHAPVAEPACSPDPVTGDTSTAVEATASGLTANTAYVYRVLATNAGGTTTGTPDRQVSTLANTPTATTEAANPVSKTTATLNGKVDPEGGALSSCQFEYLSDAEFTGNGDSYTGPNTPTSAACTPNAASIDPDGGATAVSAAIAGLSASTEYHFRLVATNPGGTTDGLDEQLTTTAVSLPSVTNDAPGTIAQIQVVIKGHVNNNDVAGGSTCKFVIALESSPGTPIEEPVCSVDPVLGSTSTGVEATASGLSPNTKYVYRVVATNGDGTSTGTPDQAVSTLPNAPTATNDAPGTIAQTQVVLKGHVDNEGAAAGSTCRFVIALESSPGTPVAEPACSPDPVTGDTSTAVEATASGLTANTAYVYRVVATNAGGTTTGSPDQAAQTLPDAPTATNDAPGTIAQTQVVLKGHVDNEGAAAGSTCRFVIALESSPGTPVAEPACSPDPVTGDTSTAVEATASGLTANTAYVYRVLATNAGGTTTGTPDRQVSTLANTHTLTLTKTGNGNGSFTCDSGSGPVACLSSYPNGTPVTIAATANGNSTFEGWSGAGCSGTGDCAVTLNADTTVTGTFTLKQHTLVIENAGTGGGSFECETGSGFGPCASSYPDGKNIIVKAIAAAGSTFSKWEGCSGGEPSPGNCGVAGIGVDTTVTATFTENTHTLTIAKAGAGAGSVTCDGVACAPSYEEGSTVTLKASPDASSTFAGWSGACSGGGDCVVTFNGDKTVTVTFDAKPAEKPAATCAADPSLCPAGEEPPNPVAGVKPDARVTGTTASLVISCKGPGACKGTLKVLARVKRGRKTKNVVIGTAPYDIAAGGSQTVKVKITNGQARKLLKAGRVVKATLSGPGLEGTVKLLPGKARKHHKPKQAHRVDRGNR